MKPHHYPSHIQDKLDELARAAEYLAEQVAKTKAAIAGARQRLSGGFQKDQEFTDLRATLDQLVKDQPLIERKLRDAQFTLADCKAWLAALPDDTTLELAPLPHNDLDLQSARQRINDAEDEIKRLRGVPVPSPEIETRIKEYVATLARPRVSGIASGQQLRIDWPNDMIAAMALLQPDTMVAALMQEVERQSNLPMPLPQRKRRIAELQAEIDTLQRQALALGAGHRRTAACGRAGGSGRGDQGYRAPPNGTQGDARPARCYQTAPGAGPVRRCPVLSKQRRTARGRLSPARRATHRPVGRVGAPTKPPGPGAAGTELDCPRGQRPHPAEGDMQALNEWSGPNRTLGG